MTIGKKDLTRQLRQILGDNIRRERIARNMSLEELSELLDLSSSTVGLIERGDRGATNHTLYRLAYIFDTTIDSFFAPRDELRVSEESDTKVKRRRITSLLSGLNERELDFVLVLIKNMKTILRNEDEYNTDESTTDISY